MSDDFQLSASNWPGLAKLVEESGEVLQVCGKLMANGGQNHHWDGTNLRDRMETELGDLQAAILFAIEYNQLDTVKIAQRTMEKLQLYEKWRREGT